MSSGRKMAFIVTRFVRMSEVLITHYSKSSYKKTNISVYIELWC